MPLIPISQADPQTQAAARIWLNTVGQPTAQYGQTQAAAAAEGASAGLSSQETTNAQLEQIVRQNEANKVAFKTQTADDFAKIKENNNGYVPPQAYNDAKLKAAGLGIGDGEFDGAFEQNSVDPNQVSKYNTGTGKALTLKKGLITQTISSRVSGLIDDFSKLGNNSLSGFLVPQKAEGNFINQAGTDARDILTGILNTAGLGGPQTNYEANRNNFNQILTDLQKQADTPGLGLNPSDVGNIASYIPAVGDNPGKVTDKISHLNDIMKSMTGQGLSDDILKKYNVNQPPITGGQVLQNGLNDILNMGKGALDNNILTMPGGILNKPEASKIATQGLDFLPGVAKEYGDLINDPIKHFQEHPVNTLADIAPVLGKFLGGSTAVDTGEASANIPGKPTGGLAAVNTISDFLKGGGTKENVLNSAKYGNQITENQVMNELGVNTKPTETGKLQAMQGGLTRYGQDLGNIYKNSTATFTGTTADGTGLGDVLKSQLTAKGWSPKAVNFMTKYVSQQGNFDLASGDTKLSSANVWQTAQKLEQNPPKNIGSEETAKSYKMLTQDAASILRDQLSKQNKIAQPYAARYGILKNAVDKASDPTGLAIRNGIMRSILSGGINSLETIPANLYKILGGKPPPRIPNLQSP